MSSTKATGRPIEVVVEDFLDERRSKNRSPRTLELYRQAVTRLAKWLEVNGRGTTVDAVNRRDMTAFMNARTAASGSTGALPRVTTVDCLPPHAAVASARASTLARTRCGTTTRPIKFNASNLKASET